MATALHLTTCIYHQGRIQGGGGGGGGQRGLLTPLQKFLVYQDRDTLIEQSL